MTRSPIIRWTVGDVSRSGFEALRLSVWGAFRLFGAEASYIVCLNSRALPEAKRLTGGVPAALQWRVVTEADLAPAIRGHLDRFMAEGVGWKFAPLLLSHDRPELALDNDCILWDLPPALRRWRDTETGVPVVAEDVRPCFGQFASMCGEEPRNSGIRALPAGFDLDGRLRRVLARIPTVLRSELDEQGLQVAALSLDAAPDVVTVDEVSICSPFPPHVAQLGRCGAHFVGLNARSLPWSFHGRPAVEVLQRHWRRRSKAVGGRVEAPGPV